MRIVLQSLTCFGILCSSAFSQSPAERTLAEKLMEGPESVKALDTVLRKSDELPALTLYYAAGVAFKEKRLEDSGFLLYAAQLRARFDKECFPAKDKGGDSPFELFAAMSEQIGGAVNPAIMAEPKTFAKAVDRVKAWEPKAPKEYEPGYPFAERKTESAAREAVKACRKDFTEHMSEFATLLNDAEYFAAFHVVQSHNLAASSNPPAEADYNKAIETMKRIEKSKGISGFVDK
jgi:hypothetical protein